MNKINKDEEIELLRLLKLWFNTYKDKLTTNRKLLNKNIVIKYLKEELYNLGFWKNRGVWKINEKSLSNLTRGEFIPPKCKICNKIMVRNKKDNKFFCSDCDWL